MKNTDAITIDVVDKVIVKIVHKVLEDLRCRRGVGRELQRVEYDHPDVYEELRESLEHIVRKCLLPENKPERPAVYAELQTNIQNILRECTSTSSEAYRLSFQDGMDKLAAMQKQIDKLYREIREVCEKIREVCEEI